MTRGPWRHRLLVTAGLLAAMLVPVAALAQAPVVKSVPWVTGTGRNDALTRLITNGGTG
jgi:hypothetical protein